MSRLDKIKESLQAKVEAGEITQESATAVLEKAIAKYAEEENTDTVTESEESTEDEGLTLEEAIDGINALLEEAEESLKCGGACCAGTATTSKEAPKLPEKTSTGEQVTNSIDANDKKSTPEMKKLAEQNDANAKKDADGEEGKDTTPQAKDLTEATLNNLKLRTYQAFESGAIDAEVRDMFLERLNLENYDENNMFKEEEESKCEEMKDDVKDLADALKDAIESKDKDAAKKALDAFKDKLDDIECDKKDDEDDEEDLEESEIIAALDDLKLRTYESFYAGNIDEDTKNTFLEYLDINNYVDPSEMMQESEDINDAVLESYSEGKISKKEALALLTK